MTGFVTVAVAADMGEAESVCEALEAAGIATTVEGAETEVGVTELGPVRVLVEDGMAEIALDLLAEDDGGGEDSDAA